MARWGLSPNVSMTDRKNKNKDLDLIPNVDLVAVHRNSYYEVQRDTS